jgi:hypothetical protein
MFDAAMARLGIVRDGTLYTWPLNELDGACFAIWQRFRVDELVTLMPMVGVRYAPLEALVHKLGAARWGNGLSSGYGLWNLVPRDEWIGGLAGAHFQWELDNQGIVNVLAGWMQTYGMPWVTKSFPSIGDLDEAIEGEVARSAEDLTAGARAPLLAYLRGDVPTATARLDRHRSAWANVDHRLGAEYEAFAVKVSRLIASAG